MYMYTHLSFPKLESMSKTQSLNFRLNCGIQLTLNFSTHGLLNSETKYINKDVHTFIFVEHINYRRTAQKSLLAGGNE